VAAPSKPTAESTTSSTNARADLIGAHLSRAGKVLRLIYQHKTSCTDTDTDTDTDTSTP